MRKTLVPWLLAILFLSACETMPVFFDRRTLSFLGVAFDLVQSGGSCHLLFDGEARGGQRLKLRPPCRFHMHPRMAGVPASETIREHEVILIRSSRPVERDKLADGTRFPADVDCFTEVQGVLIRKSDRKVTVSSEVFVMADCGTRRRGLVFPFGVYQKMVTQAL